ncbi:hypothetical protein [Aureispira sp. CCB-E]|uniref:hypothetical protein n=1 Tax=Aureispira sp. CCB-E TaxID=3051121 RepID=UPI002868BC41|nr:hypothetical protein [Aureispira sp. CCB-E]WMX16223.1 hypothetical protein QP953_07580 [Aureispira sp. CCB-E]
MSQLTNPRGNMLQRLAWFFIFLIVNQVVFPATALALTSGPSQPEVQTFQPVGTTDMVNLFSGDFSYNIPLFEVPGPDGGYPINLFYNSVTDANTEASWTGLGWNINIGSLTRSMRGLPDDFDGEQVTRKLDMLQNETVVAGVTGGLEIGGYDKFGKAVKGLGLSLSLTTNYTYNTYRGAGFSIDPTIGLKGSFGGSGGGNYKPNLSLGLNLSSTSMASLNTGFSMSVSGENVTNGFNFGLSFNGRDGLSSLSLGYTFSKNDTKKGNHDNDEKTEDEDVYNPAGGGANASYTFAKTSYTPEVKIPWTGWNIAGSFSFAPGATIVYGTFGFNGSYSIQKVKNAGLPYTSKAYGYNYLQNALDDGKSLMDFNREKDGAVHRHNRFLATPSLSYDIYSVVGQGIGGMYRAHRSDYGFAYDPELFAYTAGGAIGGQVGPHLKVGIDGSTNYSHQRNDRWPKNAGFFGNKDENYSFKTSKKGADFENVYYKTAGEMAAEPLEAYDYMGGDKPLRLKKNDAFQYDGTNGGVLEAKVVEIDSNTNKLVQDYKPVIKFDADKSNRKHKRARNISVQNISNNDLLDGNGNEILPEYDIKYYNGVGLPFLKANAYAAAPTRGLERVANEQNAGFTALGVNGVRWVYGLPVQNRLQKEAIFSVDPESNCTKRVSVPSTLDGEIDYERIGTHKYIDEKTIPQYAHSYMLTSVLGSDYVDIDNIPGPSDGDVGYWMKTNYVKLANDYQWRAPFWGANFMQGFENTKVDDMGTFMWGTREVYLPATIETKTHIAYFEISERKDAKGASAYVQNTGEGLGTSSYKLDKIKLYSKKEIDAKGISNAVPLKVVNLSYDYSLCRGVENNEERNSTDVTKGGKLTLKKVWFTYENNTRGALSPYAFKYDNINHKYDENAIDRWGAYKALPDGDNCANLHNPYTEQFSDDPQFKENLDSSIAAWHLSQIIMPSGATMNIELERDDYAYVQDVVATQMQPIFAIGVTDQNEPDQGGFLNKDASTGQEERRVYFKLEHPLLPTETDQLKKYIEDLPLVKRSDRGDILYKQVYFKTRSNLKTANDATYEYVTGYAEIEKDGNGNDIIAFDNNSPLNSEGKHTEAYITLMTSRKQVKGERYHPMLMANWDFLKNNLPDKMFAINQDPDPENAIPTFAGMGAGFAAIFLGYYGNAKEKGFGQIIDVSKSFIKLNTPDKIKYGGGSRVKKITMDDKWTPEENLTNTLGVVYDYRINDENGAVYSSGVMENETSIGYDACALKYADITEEIQGGIVKDIHVYEYPMNEGMYPGGGIGYSQVTVRSLASDYALQASKADDRAAFLADNKLPDGFGTSGQVVHQFYTAKDFPIVTDKTDLDDKETEPWLSLLSSFLMTSRRDRYTGTQGYSIELNNMHGQAKAQISYAQDNTGRIVEDKPLTKMSYEYKTKTRTVKERGKFKTINVLDNVVDVLVDDNPNDIDAKNIDAVVHPYLMGVDYDFVMDGRESSTLSTSGGAAVNVDVTGVYPLPFPWPKFSLNSNETRLAATNKIINRRGILTKTHAFDGQSHIVTSNKVFDKYTGQPLLTYVNNQLGGGIYNYTVPAYLAHSQLGMAVANVGMKFSGELQSTGTTQEFTLSAPDPANISASLIAGDEYLISDDNQTMMSRAIYLGNNIFSLENTYFTITPNVVYNFHNVRSGNKNMLSASIAQYTTVHHAGDNDDANPMNARTVKYCSPDFVEITKESTEITSISDLEYNVALLNLLLTPSIKQQWVNQPSSDSYNKISITSLLGFDCNKCVFWNQNLGNNQSGASDCGINGHFHFFEGGAQSFSSYEDIGSGVIAADLYEITILNQDPNDVNSSIVRFHMLNSSNVYSYVDKSFYNNSTGSGRKILCLDYNPTNKFRITKATHSESVQHKTINQVLSASANAYSDEWNIEHYNPCLNQGGGTNPAESTTYSSWQNPYKNGTKGVWRAKSTYTYVKDRNFVTYNPNGNNLQDVDIQQSGLVNDVPLFNWDNPFFEYCKHNWIRTEDVTKYNLAGAAVEARDILGNYQAEVYGYNDNVVTAKGVNTQYYEMGYEGFEEPNKTGTIHDLAAAGHYNNGNLDFLPFTNCSNTTVKRQENYRLCFPTKVSASGSTAYILVRKPFDLLNNSNLSEISLSLTSVKTVGGTPIKTKLEIPATTAVEGYAVNLNAGDHFQIPGLAPALDETTKDKFTIYEVTIPSNLLATMGTDWWAGDATLIYDQDLAASNSALPSLGKAQISKEKAHTGKYSLQLAMGANEVLQFPQNTLHLQTGKDYIFSAWINVKTTFGSNSLIKHTYDNGELEIKMGGVLMKPKGAIIEGWQRVEGKFTYTGNNLLTFLDTKALRLMFLDDVRIYPANANMQSYVYDPINYRLKATLDNNNYATYYVYDEDGSLILLKRETEKGVKTIQESRSYVKPNQQ